MTASTGLARRWIAAMGLCLVLLVAACTSSTAGTGAFGGGSARPLPSPSTGGNSADEDNGLPTDPDSCPAAAIAPDAKRPKVMLDFAVSEDLSTVHGTEVVEFQPDLNVTELVFRLTPNTAPSVKEGNKIEVTGVDVPNYGGPPVRYELAGADPSTQGGLLIIPLKSLIVAGVRIMVKINFTVTLGEGSFDRFGRSGSYAWFASSHPLLAWERGVGWHTEPMLAFAAESATSEAADTDLTVTAPSKYTVLMTGNPTASESAPGDRRTWRATEPAARDVSVSVGPFKVADTSVQDSSGREVPIRVGAASQANAEAMADQFERAVSKLSQLLGPFPFQALSVARLPASGGGIEYPGAILMLDSSDLVVVHETAHQWFYAMVGNSQAQHAWLDEAFASWAEEVVNGDAPAPNTLTMSGDVDTPTASYGNDGNRYYTITYYKGSAALHAASTKAGDNKFESAIRCYIKANAWQIADPADVQAALAKLPQAIAVLRDAGALH